MSARPAPPSRGDFAFFHPMRVRWGETDPQAIVFNANYFLYFDVAATEYWRAAGIDLAADMARHEVETFAVSAHADFFAPARFDDLIEVGVRLDRIGRSSMDFVLGIFRGEQPLTAGRLVYVWTTAGADPRPVPPPEDLVARMRALEARGGAS
ncbi:acyl-CoA thioesterase [Glycocaulis profundi]|nr:acyl-CoA thioesterase [Glycocaulis profundi]